MKRSPAFSKLAALTLLAALPFAASAADGLSYNFVQGNYVRTNTDAGDADGWGLNGSVAVHPNVHLFGSYANQKVDGTSVDFDGYSIEGGVRAALAPKFEGYAMLGYEDGNQFDGDVYGRLGAQVKFNQNWGVAADVKVANGGDTQWMVGPRLTW